MPTWPEPLSATTASRELRRDLLGSYPGAPRGGEFQQALAVVARIGALVDQSLADEMSDNRAEGRALDMDFLAHDPTES